MAGIRAMITRRFRVTTESRHGGPIAPDVLHHSDRRSQYTSADFRALLARAGMSSVQYEQGMEGIQGMQAAS